MTTPDGPNDTEDLGAPHGDVESLQQEVDDLRTRNDELEAAQRKHHAEHGAGAKARSAVVVLLLVLGTLCALLSPVTVWGRNLVLNTDRYVKTLEPVAGNPGVQQLVINAVNKQVESHVDVSSIVTEVLPPRAQVLASPLESAFQSLVNTITTRFVQSPAFQTLWVQINRVAHTQLVYLLTGRNSSAVQINSNGEVVLDLGPIVQQVKDRLVAAGLTVASHIPSVGATIAIGQAKGIASARKAVRALNTIADFLPWIALALFAGAIAVARRRRRALIASAFCTAGAMVFLGLGLLIGRHIYLSKIDPSVIPSGTAGYLFDTVVRFLREGIRIIFVLALIVAFVAWVTGPSRRAVATREHTSKWTSDLVEWLGTGRVGPFVAENITVMRVVVIAVALIILVFGTGIGWVALLVIALITAALLILLEAVRREANRRSVPPSVPPPATA
jgi:hypothetical protein